MGVRRFCYNLAVATHRFHRANRMPWPSWQDLYKAFNACKREDYPFATEVASRVAEGAFMDFGKSVANWRNTGLRARAPRFVKKKTTGTGSFRAASGVGQIRYNGKRRITLPVIGSLKMDHTLPEGIIHEAHIRRENGRWYLCVKMWKQPDAAPQDTRTQGAVDTCHFPASIPTPPTPTAIPTRTPRPTTGWSEDSAAGSGPRPAGQYARGAGGKPSAGSTIATGVSEGCGRTPSTR